jgi:threonine/homoserine/homoserine lactone efflux protein
MFHQTVFDSARFLIFLSAAVLLAIAPGPGMLYVLARTLAGGRREGLLSALGTFFGGMAHVFAAAAGVSIILAKSAMAFATVKYLGAGYLCFLGIRMILDARKKEEGISLADLPRGKSPFWQGVMTEVLNPKTALFFLSFIPQFVNRTHDHVFLQFVLLGNTLGDAQHFGRYRRDASCRAARSAHSQLGALPPPSTHRDRRGHDWLGDLLGFRRVEVTYKFPGEGASLVLQFNHLVIVAIGMDRLIEV